jgi:polar amino acid transport system permease protein
MNLDWGVVWTYRWSFVAGIEMTVFLTVATMAISLPLGVLVMLLRQCGVKPIEWLATAYVELFRNLPLLLIVYWAYYVLPRFLPFSLDRVTIGIAGLVLNVTAYNAENFRAGVNSVRRGQSEAALTLGMSRAEAMRYVVLPQAIRRVAPVLASTWVSLFKGTSLVSAIGVADLYYVALEIRGETFRVLEVLTAMGVIYWVLAYPQSKFVDWLHRKYGYSE